MSPPPGSPLAHPPRSPTPAPRMLAHTVLRHPLRLPRPRRVARWRRDQPTLKADIEAALSPRRRGEPAAERSRSQAPARELAYLKN